MIELQLAGISRPLAQDLELGMIGRSGEATDAGKRRLGPADMVCQVGVATSALHVSQLDQRNVASLVFAVTGAAADRILRLLVGMVRRTGVARFATSIRGRRVARA